METPRLTEPELAAWTRLAAVLELLPGILEAQLRRDSDLTHFEYFTLAMLSEAPERTLRMTALAAQTNATLPRLSHVVRKLEDRGLIQRSPCPEDARATNARLTAEGWRKVQAAAPGHVMAVRKYVMEQLAPEQVAQLIDITEAILGRVDPDGALSPNYRRHSGAPSVSATGSGRGLLALPVDQAAVASPGRGGVPRR